MEIKTSKIKTIVASKDFKNSFGTTIYHDLLMENGDKISIGKKTLQKVGWELTYSITDEGFEYQKAKGEQKQDVPVTQTVSQTPQPSNSLNVQNLIVAQNSITNAVNFCEKSPNHSATNVLEVADIFYKWVMSKG